MKATDGAENTHEVRNQGLLPNMTINKSRPAQQRAHTTFGGIGKNTVCTPPRDDLGTIIPIMPSFGYSWDEELEIANRSKVEVRTRRIG